MQHTQGTKAGIWKRAFGHDVYSESPAVRDRFSRALADTRERANQLALDIATDLPEFTRHDEFHMDALWELADLIAGPGISLNPAEAFVLGGAILTHDLAMSRAAHQLAGGELRGRAEWPDALAIELRRHLGRAPHPSELASPPTEPALAAEKALLRALHAEVAESLPLSSWKSLRGDSVYMISDADIRTAYGRLIGSIAASHHWSYDDVVSKFSAPIGVPGFAPVDWKVDGLLLALLLRTADAAHLDSSRAPDLLAAIRNLPSDSVEHWVFQSRLQRPYLQNGRLIFTAPDGFSRDEMGAWWLAYDTLNLVDSELKGADTILLEKGRTPLLARGVAHVESPREFSSVVLCRDWEPVEARIKVGDVAGLVRRLGGSELYGSDPTIGLRELLTNACDAVKAREALMLYRGGRPFFGRVSVWIEEDSSGHWLVCSDNGIGMTPEVLGRQFLDFGCSSWLSPEVVRDNIGLLASRFEPTGKFGIGFFSVFMMGNRVEVWSRPLSGAPSDTWNLEFSSGVEVRPILRRAKRHEEMDEPGTTIRVLLDEGRTQRTEADNAYTFNATAHSRNYQREGAILLSEIIGHILPAPQADIWVSDNFPNENPHLLMTKDDWLTIDGVSLLQRVFGVTDEGNVDRRNREFDPKFLAEKFGPKLKTILTAEGLPVGRACLIGEAATALRYGPYSSTVTAGPTRTETRVNAVMGLFIGKPSKAARDAAVPMISPKDMARWVSLELADLVRNMKKPAEWCRVLGEQVSALGGDHGDLPTWQVKGQWLTYTGLVSWLGERDSVIGVDSLYAAVRVGTDAYQVDLLENVVLVESGWSPAIDPEPAGWSFSDHFSNTVQGVFLRAIAEAWGEKSMMSAMQEILDGHSQIAIGSHEGKEVHGNAFCATRAS
ncbi:HD domain-containing protein [Streptomyces sp. DSM 41033]|uniref:HD domain-containing protein n=1 Tax=Streptomyces sp. DSM 41033 TaxID=3448655 RepID=UPI00404037CA